MKNIAKLTSYGCYLDCDFITAKYPEDEIHIVGNVAEYVYDLEHKISDLEAKLAEKEKELTAKETLNQIFKDNREAKISFALEQLEKVKEYIHGKYLDETWHNKIVDEDREDTHDFIDNQIKQLKEGK